jgi:hypothetical protein
VMFITHFIGIGTSVSHGKSSATVVQIVGMKFIGKGHFVSPNGRFVSRYVGRISALNHETTDISMENGSIVLSRCGQGQEIKGGARTSVAKDFAFQVSDGGVDSDRHGVAMKGVDSWELLTTASLARKEVLSHCIWRCTTHKISMRTSTIHSHLAFAHLKLETGTSESEMMGHLSFEANGDWSSCVIAS